MPLVNYSLEIIKQVLAEVGKDSRKTGKVLTLSHPDLIVSTDWIKQTFNLDHVKLREDAASIVNWHKSHAISTEVVDTAWLFKQLGYTMTAVDLVAGRGGEVICDLNFGMPPEISNAQFDLVIDIISNQVFSISQCMLSAACAVRAGGFILHVISMTMNNQGFYCCSPTLYHDFYKHIGFELRFCRAIVGVNQAKSELTLEPNIRNRNVPDDVMNVVLARRLHVHDWWSVPIMSKFKEYPDCKR